MCNMHTHGMAASQETSADEAGARVAQCGTAGCSAVWWDIVEHVGVWHNVVQHDMEQHYVVWQSPPWHDRVKCGVVWLSMAWHHVTWGWMGEQQLGRS